MLTNLTANDRLAQGKGTQNRSIWRPRMPRADRLRRHSLWSALPAALTLGAVERCMAQPGTSDPARLRVRMVGAVSTWRTPASSPIWVVR